MNTTEFLDSKCNPTQTNRQFIEESEKEFCVKNFFNRPMDKLNIEQVKDHIDRLNYLWEK